MLSPTAAGVRVPGSPEEVRSAGETNMSREENKSKFGGRLGYILNDSTALPRVTFSNGLIRRLGYPGGVLFFDVAPNFSVARAGLEGSVMARNPRESVTRSTALRLLLREAMKGSQ